MSIQKYSRKIVAMLEYDDPPKKAEEKVSAALERIIERKTQSADTSTP